MRTIKLYGQLARKYGETHTLDVATPAEAVSAMFANYDEFKSDFLEHNWSFVCGEDVAEGRPVSVDKLHFPISEKEDTLHLMPEPEAAYGLIIAAVVIVVAIVLAVVLAPKPPDPNDLEADKKASYIFDGPANVTEQGHPVPLVYGRVLVGSVVASSSITNAKIIPDFQLPYVDDLASDAVGNWLSGGGDAPAPTEDENSLQSVATGRIVDIVSEGEVGGVVGGLKGLYLNGTPVQNEDNTYNFQGIQLDQRQGVPDQPSMSGFPSQETTIELGTDVTIAGGPITHTITNPNADRARVTIRLPSLHKTIVDTGDIKATTVQVKISVQADGGGYEDVLTKKFSGKNTAPYDEDFEFALPPNGNPWNIRVTRITPDSSTSSVSDATTFQNVTEIVDAKLTYPNMAVYGVTVDARQFGSNIPNRSYLMDGIKCLVPDNYDPATRVYTGTWNGTFKRAVTDNPAWIFYDMVTNGRYGLGRFLLTAPNKFDLYRIAQYCDEMVSDGNGGTEPRFSLNGVISKREQAIKVLRDIASAFNSFLYATTTTLALRQDSPPVTADDVKLVVPARTVKGEVEYQGLEPDTLYTAVIVSFNDPEDGYKLGYEVVQDFELVRKYGWIPKELASFMSTSRGRAHRLGREFLDNQVYQTTTVSYQSGADHGFAQCGDLIEVHDPLWTGSRRGGLISASTATSITIDKPVDIVSGRTYTLKFTQRDGTIISKTLTNSVDTEVSLLTWSGGVTAPAAGAVWSLSDDQVVNRQFRIRRIREKRMGEYTIEGTLHDANKYARIEQGIKVEPATFIDLPIGPPQAPSNINVLEFLKQDGNSSIPSAQISWTRVSDARVVDYQVMWLDDNDDTWATLPRQDQLIGRELVNVAAGTYSFRVRAVTDNGLVSEWAVLNNENLFGPATSTGIPAVTGLALVRDADLGFLQLTWTEPNDIRPMYYEVWYNASADNFGSATRKGITDDTNYVINQAGHYYIVCKFMTEVGTPTHLHVQESDLVTFRSDIDLNAENIAAEILQGAAHRAYTDLQLYVNGQGVGTFAETNIEQLNTDSLQYASRFDLLGAVNGANNAFIIDASTVQVDDGATVSDFVNLVSEWNGNTASITTLNQTVDGLSARAGITLDVNGYATGWTFDNGGGPQTSNFTVKTPNFFIIDPANGLSSPRQVFSIQSGVVRMPNVEVDTLVADSITTNHLQDNSVSATAVALNTSNRSVNAQEFKTLMDGTTYDKYSAGSYVRVIASVLLSKNSGSEGEQIGVAMELRRNGAVLKTRYFLMRPLYPFTFFMTEVFTNVPAGVSNWEIYVSVGNTNGGISGVTCGDSTLQIEEMKK